MKLRLVFALVLVAAAGEATADGIWRCDGDGRVTYQQSPCGIAGAPAGIATDYPPVNMAERERLLAREAALDARLEARRGREIQEAVAKSQREVRVVREAAPIEPVYVVVRAPARHIRGPRPLTVR